MVPSWLGGLVAPAPVMNSVTAPPALAGLRGAVHGVIRIESRGLSRTAQIRREDCRGGGCDIDGYRRGGLSLVEDEDLSGRSCDTERNDGGNLIERRIEHWRGRPLT